MVVLKMMHIISQDQNFPNYNQSIELPLSWTFLIDIDKDEVKDLIISPNGVNISERKSKKLFVYKNIGPNENGMFQFEFIKNNLFVENMIDVGSSGIPILHDLNNDGLLDLIIGNKGYYNEANYDSQLKAYKILDHQMKLFLN